jgi:hypothetical protein
MNVPCHPGAGFSITGHRKGLPARFHEDSVLLCAIQTGAWFEETSVYRELAVSIKRAPLQNIDTKAVEIAYDQAFAQAGRSFSDGSSGEAAAATEGYPYLIQLLGYYLFNSGRQTLDSRLVRQSLELAKIELFKNVHDMLYQELSAKDREFLFAMARDAGRSDFASIRERLGVPPGYASKYRERLLMAGMVKAVAHGVLAFAPPYMREYLLSRE